MILERLESSEYLLESFPVGNLQSNCTIISHKDKKTAFVVDPGETGNEVRAYLKQHDLVPLHFAHTHAHFDHIASASKLKEEYKSNPELSLHRDDRELFLKLSTQGAMFGVRLDAPSGADLYFGDNHHFDFFDPSGSIEVLHTPGHTQGSCCFYIGKQIFERPVLISGDTLFLESIGRTDLPGGDFHTIIRSIKNRLWVLPADTLVIPGHGDVTEIDHEKKYNPFLKQQPL